MSSDKKRVQEVEPEVITSKKRPKVNSDTGDAEIAGHYHQKPSSLEERNSPTVIGNNDSKTLRGCSITGRFDAAATLTPFSEKESSTDDVLARLLKQRSSNKSGINTENDNTFLNFPERLMDLLEKGVAKDAMWFLSRGDGFAVVPKLFSEQVLDKFFQGSKYESFTRKLNRWGFKRMTYQSAPRHIVAFTHYMFQRGEPSLLRKMSDNKKKEPNFQLFTDLYHASHNPSVGSISSLPSVRVSMDTVVRMNKFRAENTMVPQTSTEVLLHSLVASQLHADEAVRRQAELLALAIKQQQKPALMSHLYRENSGCS